MRSHPDQDTLQWNKCYRFSFFSACITRWAPDKRQRVLLSPRDDEVMENVHRSLQEVSLALRKLLPSSTHSNLLSRTPHPLFHPRVDGKPMFREIQLSAGPTIISEALARMAADSDFSTPNVDNVRANTVWGELLFLARLAGSNR